MTRKATLYRMKLADHECPYGLRARDMLEEAGFEIEEHLLTTRDEVEAFKAEHGVNTTPVIFIDGAQIDGSGELAEFLEQAQS